MKKAFTGKTFVVSMIIATGIAAAVSALNFAQRKGISETISNACFAAAVLVGGFGCLMLAGNEGVFDIFGYGISFVTRIHWPGLGAVSNEHQNENYADYKLRKQKERKSPAGILLAGGVYLAFAVVMLTVHLLQNL